MYVYITDENGLFYQMMPNKTMFKEKTIVKKSKQRLTVLLYSKSTETDKLKSLVIEEYTKPMCF